ncbi:MAG: polysaccharide biosynthesis/export family protein [Verrucomicrobiota bacterium]
MGRFLFVGFVSVICACFAYAEYSVGPNDVLRIEVGGESDLSGTFTVSEEGSIVYPLLGTINLAGRDVDSIAGLVRTRLESDYLVSPQVAVYVEKYASKKIFVLGNVPSPGVYTLKNDSTLLSVLSAAGLKLSNSDTTIIIKRASWAAEESREKKLLPLVLDLDTLLNPWQEARTIPLRDGDQVMVKAGTGGKVVVSGKVKEAGSVPFTDGITALEAINKAGGFAEFAATGKVRVIRQTPEGSEVMEADLSAVMSGDRSKDIELEKGDIVVVPRRWF